MLRFLSFTLCLSFALAAVVELDSSNFDSVVDGSNNVLVEFYAPWCGHCKNLAPEYEIVGDLFKKSDGVIIAKVNADQEKSLGSKYGVSGFPTLKWFPKGSKSAEEFGGGRSAETIVNWINGETGLNRMIKKAPTSVAHLTALDFESVVFDPKKAVMVEFYAPWCGHCKSLAPKYEKVAKAFEAEPDVIVAAVDATQYGALASQFEVTGYPTLKFFGFGDNKEAETYGKGRTEKDLVAFLNEKTGSHRTVDGELDETAGRLSQLDELVKNTIDESFVSELEALIAQFEGKHAEYAQTYLKIAKKVLSNGANYIDKELNRLEGMIKNPAINNAKRTQFMIKRNILHAFH